MPDEPVAGLLGDPATVRTAADALVHTERADEPAWPLVVTVGSELVTLHWAGLSAPAPHEPWRLGQDPRRWIADRAEVADIAGIADAVGPGALRPVLVGKDGDAIVFVNTSRAPGPLAVEAAAGAAPRSEVLAALVELVARQQPGVDRRGGGWWPLDVAGEAILLLGTPIGTTLSVESMRRGAELSTAPMPTIEPVAKQAPQPEPEVAQAVEQRDPVEVVAAPVLEAKPEPVREAKPEPKREPEPRDEAFEEWLRQVRMAVVGGVTLRREAEPVRQAALPVAETPAAEDEIVNEGVKESVEETGQIPKIVVEDQQPDQPDRPGAPVDEELDDWAADFAVSSADGGAAR